MNSQVIAFTELRVIELQIFKYFCSLETRPLPLIWLTLLLEWILLLDMVMHTVIPAIWVTVASRMQVWVQPQQSYWDPILKTKQVKQNKCMPLIVGARMNKRCMLDLHNLVCKLWVRKRPVTILCFHGFGVRAAEEKLRFLELNWHL
jgi:hypothetical protein